MKCYEIKFVHDEVFYGNLVENRVTDAEDVDYNRVFKQRQQVVGHSLPEVEQKVLDLNKT